jgi:cytochrome c55X
MVRATRAALVVAVAAAGVGAAESVVAAGIAVASVNHIAALAVAPVPERRRELLVLLKNDCGSCHGMRLTGGLGPALTPEALRAKPVESLVATIVSGRPGTAMPPWRRFLSEADAEWLVTRMVTGDVDVP